MPRAAWIILGVAGALVVLLLVGVAIAVATVDPDRVVAPLAARVKAETGRDLKIQGPVDFKISLEPKIVLPGVTLENAPWSKTREMLAAKRIEAQFALLPLLSRRFEIVQFTLVDPVIALETDSTGRGNWEFGTQSAGAAGPASATAGTAPAFGIGNFEIHNGTLTYRDGATGKLTSASIERMTLHARDMQAPVAIDFRGSVDNVPVAITGDLGAPDKWLRQQWPYPVTAKGEVAGNAVKVSTKVTRAGTTTTLEDLDVSYGPFAGKGTIRAIGEGAKTRYVIDFSMPVLALTDAAAKPPATTPAAPPATMPAAPAAPTARWLIPDSPLPLAPLVAVDSDGTLNIGELRLRDGQRLTQLATQFTSRGAILDAKFSVASILGGSMRGELHIDGHTDTRAVRLRAEAQDLDLVALAASAGIKRDIRGGKVRVTIDISGRGETPHKVASTMTGSILVVSGPATLGRSAVKGESAASQVVGALDPFAAVDATTELRCAVFRLPLADGIAHVDRSIAVETGKIAGSASGTLNFRDETLDLSVQPQLREGARIDISQFASLVRVRGRFDKPSVAVDAAQSAALIAKMGALGATGGGLAMLGGALLGSTAGSSAPCAVAMSGKAPREPTTASRSGGDKLPAVPQDVGKALGRLFGR